MVLVFALIVGIFSTLNLASTEEICQSGQTYDLRENTCKYLELHSTGIYPNCVCDEKDYVYIIYFNLCAASFCPPNSTGSWPYCKCNDDESFFVIRENACKYEEVEYNYVDGNEEVDQDNGNDCDEGTNDCRLLGPLLLKCPFAVATGTYPNCTCIEQYEVYSVISDTCLRICPKNSTGDWPLCICDDNGLGIEEKQVYHEETNSCKNIECPYQEYFDDIEIYPNCSCKYRDYDYSVDLNICFQVCPREDSIGVYPNCTCTRNNFEHDTLTNDCVHICPKNTTGDFWPSCICDDNGLGIEKKQVFNEETDSCKNIECPHDDSVGIYPNCKCVHNNFDYSVDFNICFRVCPESSTGYWPNCICNDDGYFDKKKFECLSCPTDATGTYPNCVCSRGMSFVKGCNFCEKCPNDSVGVYPDCACAVGYSFNAFENECIVPWTLVETTSIDENIENIQCPMNTFGTFPKCTCENNGTYDYISQSCHTCGNSEEYSLHSHRCIRCSGDDVFNPTYGVCTTAETQCPAGSVGLHPYCTCETGKYNSDSRSCDICVGYYFRGPEVCFTCPSDATGIYPNCKCENNDYAYDLHPNLCNLRCEHVETHWYTFECQSGFYFDYDSLICKEIAGRKCPIGSIGTDPDCLCMKEGDKFDAYYWSCNRPPPPPQPPPPPTQGGPNKFEDLSPVDIILLRSLIG